MCGEPARSHGWTNQGFFYTALITGLTEGVQVFYVVGSDQYGYSAESHFFGTKHPSSATTLRVSVIADVGVTHIDGSQYHWMEPYSINTTNNLINAWPEDTVPRDSIRFALNKHAMVGAISGKSAPRRGQALARLALADSLDNTDLVLHIGDISYATGYSSKWDRFMNQIEPIASRVPYMTGFGNHERDFPGTGSYYVGQDSGGECGAPTEYRFIMPTPSKKQDSAWYSFDQGPVHFLMMNTEMHCGQGSSQYRFFEEDLATVNRSATPWVIFMGHRPMYHADRIDRHFQEFEPLLYRHKVDLCMWGHEHFAQRTCPVYDGECMTPDETGYAAPIHAVVGNGGMSLTVFPETIADWSVYQSSEFGYSTLQINGTHLVMKFFADENNELHHEFTIEKPSTK
jgi:hypothetical protein